MSSGIDRLLRHVEECDSCRQGSPSIKPVDALLGSSRVDLDVEKLSRQAFAAAQPVLHKLALRHFWRQVTVVVVLALVPLPIVLAYDALLLRLVHGLASSLSVPMANYIIFMQGSFLIFLFAASYAAIPLLMARTMPRLSTHG